MSGGEFGVRILDFLNSGFLLPAFPTPAPLSSLVGGGDWVLF